jgi:hypothetical protein
MQRSAPPRPSRLQDVNDLIEQARQIADRALDPSTTPEELQALSSELETITSDLHSVDAGAIPELQRPAPAPSVPRQPKPLTPPVVESDATPVALAGEDVRAPAPEEPAVIPEPEASSPVVSPAATQPIVRPSSGGGWRTVFLFAVLLLAVGFAAGYLWMIGSAALRAQRTAMISSERLMDLRDARSADPSKPAADPLSAIQDTCLDASELERDLRSITDLANAAGGAEMLDRVPGVGTRASAMLALAQAAKESSSAVRITCDAIGPIGSGTSGDAEVAVASMLGGFHARRAELRNASVRLHNAHRQLQDVDEAALDEPAQRALKAMRDKLPAAAGRVALMSELPAILGMDGPRSYLVLGQNSDELRPSGGFIGTSGVMTFEGGRLTQSEYGSSFGYALPFDERVPPPAPLSTYMAARYWQFWESNWWPDFPSSARQAEYFHREAERPPVHGVIAVNQEIIRSLLKVTGPVSVPEFGETVDATNVQDRMEFHVHESNYPDPIRKKFVSSLFTGVMERVHRLPRERIGDLTAAINEGFYEQNIQMWSADPSSQEVLASLGWDGGLIQAPSDYINIVSANLGANKVNKDVRQSASYQVIRGLDDNLLGSLEVRMKNDKASADPGPYKTADYRNYLRVYAPRGSQLLATGGFDGPVEELNECGFAAFAGFVALSPGEESSVRLQYRLPASVRADSYSLVVQRQSGVRPYPVTVNASGLGFGSRTVELEGSQHLVASEGALSASRLQGSGGMGGGGCEIHLAAPKPLAVPTQFTISNLNIDAKIVELGIDPDGTLQSPDNGRDVGWYRQGARPGYGGNMVISGHLDYDRAPGVFWRLGELDPGDDIKITGEDGVVHTYRVDWMRIYEASEAPLNQILGPTTESWLTLITCAGQFDRSSQEYLDRVVVRAHLVS